MLIRQKCSHRKGIEAHKIRKSKEKIELKFTIEEKEVTAEFSAENNYI